MKRYHAAVIVLAMSAVLSHPEFCSAQEPFAFNEVSFLAEESGFGARAMGMGGAYLAAADDYSALYWNPAGLALIRQNEMFASLTHNQQRIETRFLTIPDENDKSKTALGAIGYAVPVDVARGSLVFAGGYNRVVNYNTLFGYHGFNPGPSYMGFAFDEPFVPDRLTQDELIEITGNLSQFSLGGAFEAAKDVFIGFTVNYWRGNNTYNQVFSERDDDNLYTSPPDDFDSYRNESVIDTDIRGFDLVAGAIVQFTPRLRFGATLNTPRYVTLEENFSSQEDVVFDNDESANFSETGTFKYKVRMPFIFGAGFTYSFPKGIITGDIRYTDWSQLEFRDDFPVSGISKGDANRNINRTVEGVISPRVGVELVLTPAVQVRGGYMFEPSPIKDAASNNDRNYLSFGLGIVLNELAHIDFAYRRGWWDNSTVSGSSAETVSEQHTENRFFTTLKIVL